MLTDIYQINNQAENISTAGCCDVFGYGCTCRCNNS